jgi:hypothetical protein
MIKTGLDGVTPVEVDGREVPLEKRLSFEFRM